MPLKPWYKVVTPREDLREGKPLDAAEFAVHLDDVRNNCAPPDYQKPDRFFARTYLTKNLSTLATEVIRRLSGQRTETSAVFNLATQFGGGKTHALTLLYHLARNGAASHKWAGVPQLLAAAGVKEVPKAATAVFVGAEFDSIRGRGGEEGEPLRKTPWGEIAWQLGGANAFALVAEHEKAKIAPSGEVIREVLKVVQASSLQVSKLQVQASSLHDSGRQDACPTGLTKSGRQDACPTLILMDELMNYVSRNRKNGLGTQLYHFLQNLSEVARGLDGVVLAVSIPASEMEMTTEDQSDYERFKKMLDRLGKAIVMSAEAEASEIIRRRLFEWDERAINSEGKVLLPKEAIETCNEYGDWVVEHRQQLPNWFPLDGAHEQFAATYPFHPTAISVFERKWQELPRFQQTRGVLRMLALWVANAYQQGFKGGHKDPLIGLGTAPLEDSLFRSAVFEQLGETKLEGAVTTDICGKKASHAARLDAEAPDTIKNARLHRKVAAVILFESNGGQAKGEATQPEVRLAVAEPGLDIGNIETALESLTESCYYLTVERNRYRFSLKENLNKRFADRRATIQPPAVDERVREEIQKVFGSGAGILPTSTLDRIYFPEKSNQVPDRPVVTLVLLPPEQSLQDEKATTQFVETITRESGSSSRTFKSALIFCVPDAPDALCDEARKVLAWEDIDDEAPDLKLDDTQVRQLEENVKKARRDLKESIWRTYKCLMLLAKDNTLKKVDMGLVHSSAAPDMATLVINHLRQTDDLVTGVSPGFLTKHWPPAFTEWATKSVRDAFFASPQFPRLLSADAIRDTIVRGVANGLLAYVGKCGAGFQPAGSSRGAGVSPANPSADAGFAPVSPSESEAKLPAPPEYKLFYFNQALMTSDIEFSEEMFLITKETAEAYLKAKCAPPEPKPTEPKKTPDAPIQDIFDDKPAEPQKPEQLTFSSIAWTGDVPPQKWMKFYTAILSKFPSSQGLKLKVSVEISPDGGISRQKLEETKAALRELGLSDAISPESLG